jgi:hypothetical protein
MKHRQQPAVSTPGGHDGAQRDLNLMPEHQVLEREIPPRSNGSNERMEGKPEQFEQPSG